MRSQLLTGAPAGGRARGWAIAVALAVACGRDEAPTGPDLKASGPAPLKATPATLGFVIPPGGNATVTATVQYVGLITARSSDAGCATVSPLSVPAVKPPGSSVYVATFTVTPVAAGSCTITVTDKKGNQAQVQVTVVGRQSLDRIVFASFGTTRKGLFVMHGDGSGLAPIIDHGFGPALSPDGTQVAYECEDPNATTFVENICVVGIDGSNDHHITSAGSDFGPKWTLDGSKIVFWSHRDGHHIWIVDADGQHLTDLTAVTTRLIQVGRPTLSPDGSRVAYATGDQDGNGIWAMNIDGTAPAKLAGTGTLPPDHLAWSPDGSSFLFDATSAGHRFIYRLNADGTGLTQLTPGTELEEEPAWSPDGTRYAFHRAGDVFSRALDGTDEIKLTDDPADDFAPDWR